jgi:hypothetical protein
MVRAAFLSALALLISGCANIATYQPYSMYNGGYTDEQLSEAVYKVSFSGSLTNQLTVQTYWLYRAAELTLEKGFDGFEILDASPTERPTALSGNYRVRCEDLNLMCLANGHNSLEQASAVIHLLKAPVKPVPYKVFDAKVLKERMTPIVKGKNCGESGLMFATSQVCPHDKSYLVAP